MKRKITKYYLEHDLSPQTEKDVQTWLLRNSHEKEVDRGSLEFWEEIDNSVDDSVAEDSSRVMDKVFGTQNTRRQSVKGVYCRKNLFRIVAIFIPVLLISGFLCHLMLRQTNLAKMVVPSGMTEDVYLPDGSHVMVDGGSELIFKESRDGKSRIAELTGKAKFEVKHIDHKPFIVQTENLSIKVLGTVFDVDAYEESGETRVTLDQGAVEVVVGELRYQLTSGQTLTYDLRTHDVTITTLAADNVDDIAFSKMGGATLSQIFSALEKKYDVEIDVPRKMRENNDIYSVDFNNDDDIELIMGVLSDLTGNWAYKIFNDKIVINK